MIAIQPWRSAAFIAAIRRFSAWSASVRPVLSRVQIALPVAFPGDGRELIGCPPLEVRYRFKLDGYQFPTSHSPLIRGVVGSPYFPIDACGEYLGMPPYTLVLPFLTIKLPILCLSGEAHSHSKA